MKENSFESVKSDFFEEQNELDDIKDKIINNKNSNIIDESKTQIRKSLMFSSLKDSSPDLNNINNIDFFQNNQKLFLFHL